MKFGGTSVADLERIRRVARLVAAEAEAGFQVAVVVSAMAGKTNELVAWTDGAGAAARLPCCATWVGIAPVVGTAIRNAVATREKIKRRIAKRHRHEWPGA